MGRPNTAVTVSAAEAEQLGAISRSRSLPHSLVRRARIVLMSAEGISNEMIAARCEVSVPTISLWRRCWCERGIAELHGELRPGRPRSYVMSGLSSTKIETGSEANKDRPLNRRVAGCTISGRRVIPP
jgi:hypothetical protein